MTDFTRVIRSKSLVQSAHGCTGLENSNEIR